MKITYSPFVCIDGWVMYLAMSTVYSVIMGLFGSVCGLKIRIMFNSPFQSVCLYEFWSRRWNMVFKDKFSRLTKLLFGSMLDRRFGRDKKVHSTMAALLTFSVSALAHEYIMCVTFGWREFGYHVGYFAVHGILTTVEVLWLRSVYKSMTGPLGTLGRFAITTVVLILTSQIFFYPILRAGFYIDLSLPKLSGVAYKYGHLIFNT